MDITIAEEVKQIFIRRGVNYGFSFPSPQDILICVTGSALQDVFAEDTCLASPPPP